MTIDAELAAQPPDEHFDGVGVAVEVLVVEMLDQFAARDDAADVMHEIAEQPVFVAGQLDRASPTETRPARVSSRTWPTTISQVAWPEARRSSARSRASSSSMWKGLAT